MDEDLISIRAFAQLDGCDESLVRRAVKQGRLVAQQGKLPAALAGTPWRERRPKRSRAAQSQGADTTADKVRTECGHPADTSADRSAEVERTVRDDETIEEAARRIADAAAVVPPIGDSMARKEHFLALLRELEYGEKSGELVQVEMARRVIFEGARTFRDALMHWPSRVAPLIATEIDVDASQLAASLTAHVDRLLNGLSDPPASFDSGQ